MGIVGLDDHGATGGKRRRGVTTRDGERERKVTGAEYCNGPERHGALADVGPRHRFPVGLGGIDAGAVPTPLPQHRGEQSQLSGGPADLARDARLRQAGLRRGPSDERLTERLDVVGDQFEEVRPPLGAGGAVLAEGGGRRRTRGLDVSGVAVAVAGFEVGAHDGIEGTDLGAVARDGCASNDHPAGEGVAAGFGVTSCRRSHVVNGRAPSATAGSRRRNHPESNDKARGDDECGAPGQ